MFKVFFFYIISSFILLPVYMVRAADTGVVGGGDDTGVVTPTGGGSVTLSNPLHSTTITEFLQSLLNVIMVFAVPLIVFMIIYAGFTYVMARGNEAEVGKAHRALLYAVIGGVIILGANAILAVIQGTVDSF